MISLIYYYASLKAKDFASPIWMKFILLFEFDPSNYTIENFELYNFYPINRAWFSVTFFLASSVYWPLMFVIVTKSPKRIRTYSCITAYELTVAYVFTTLLFLAQPVFLFPYKGAYITGYFQVGEAGNPALFFSVIISIVFIFHACSTQLLHRLGVLYPVHHKLNFFAHPKKLIGLLGPILIILLILISGGFGLDQPQGELFRSILMQDHAYFKDFFFYHPHAMGYHEAYSEYIELLFISVGVVGVLAPPFLVIIIIFFYTRMRHFQRTLSSSRQKWQAMFIRALLAQSGAIIMFLIVPLDLFIFFFFFPSQRSAFYGSSMPLIASQYVIVASLSQAYFIKPYQNYFNQKLKRFFPMFLSKHSVVTNGY